MMKNYGTVQRPRWVILNHLGFLHDPSRSLFEFKMFGFRGTYQRRPPMVSPVRSPARARLIRRRRFINTYGGRLTRSARRAGLRSGMAGVYGLSAYNIYKGHKSLGVVSKRARARRQIGNYVGSSNAKRRLDEGSEVLTTKTLSGNVRLLDLPKTTTNDESVLNERLRNVVNFRGCKICFHIDINSTTGRNGDKLFFNWAIISPKQQDPDITTIDTAEFFRGQDGARFTSFIGTTLTGLDCRCLPINTDKYIVHRHKRVSMGPWESTEGKGEKLFETYIPIKRQVRYNTTGSGAALDNPEARDMWMVYWIAYQNETTAAPVASVATVRYRMIKYFREPKA